MNKRFLGLVIALSLVLLVPGIFVPVTASAKGEVHEIEVSDTAFTPPSLNIKPGDVVRWVWTSGSHNISSGIPEDEEAGNDFIFAINSEVKEVLRTFDDPGSFRYFSQEKLDSMTGVIVVSETTPVTPATWGWLKSVFEDKSSPRLPR